MDALTNEEARSLLPEVGDIRMEFPTVQDAVDSSSQRKCIVTEVNVAHLWYRVRFLDTGFYECYKVPKLKRKKTGDVPW